MAITSIGNSYGNVYENTYTMQKASENTEKNSTAKEITESGGNTRKSALEELSYLSDKYGRYTFVAADYTQGMRYGTDRTTNIAVSPMFLKRMAENPALEKEYESYFGKMREADEENIRSHEAGGRQITAQGWAIDKDGGISRWGVSEPKNKRHNGQELMEYTKLRKQSTGDYINKLAKLAPSLEVRVGSTFSSARNGKTLTINPGLLAKMQNNPEQEAEMKELIKGIEAVTRFMDGIDKASGKKVVYRHGYIDENGKYYSYSYTKNEYGRKMSDKLREERRENTEKLIRKIKKKALKRKENLEDARIKKRLREKQAKRVRMNFDRRV